MPERNNTSRTTSLLVLALALALFASPFTASWAGFRPPWYVPYLLWLLLIGIGAFLSRSQTDDDH